MNDDTPPHAVQARRNPSGEHDANFLAVLEGLGRLESKVDKLAYRLAEGATKMALHDERLENQGRLVHSLTGRVDRQGERLDELSDVMKAAACETCEERIDALEKREDARTTRDESDQRHATKAPPWWLQAILTTALSLLTAALVVWALKGAAAHLP